MKEREENVAQGLGDYFGKTHFDLTALRIQNVYTIIGPEIPNRGRLRKKPS